MKHENKYTDTTSHILLIASILLAVLSLALSFYTLLRFQDFDKTFLKQQSDINGKVAQVVFCHDRGITPCDEIAIRGWNASHPDDTFNIPK